MGPDLVAFGGVCGGGICHAYFKHTTCAPKTHKAVSLHLNFSTHISNNFCLQKATVHHVPTPRVHILFEKFQNRSRNTQARRASYTSHQHVPSPEAQGSGSRFHVCPHTQFYLKKFCGCYYSLDIAGPTPMHNVGNIEDNNNKKKNQCATHMKQHEHAAVAKQVPFVNFTPGNASRNSTKRIKIGIWAVNVVLPVRMG